MKVMIHLFIILIDLCTFNASQWITVWVNKHMYTVFTNASLFHSNGKTDRGARVDKSNPKFSYIQLPWSSSHTVHKFENSKIHWYSWWSYLANIHCVIGLYLSLYLYCILKCDKRKQNVSVILHLKGNSKQDTSWQQMRALRERRKQVKHHWNRTDISRYVAIRLDSWVFLINYVNYVTTHMMRIYIWRFV